MSDRNKAQIKTLEMAVSAMRTAAKSRNVYERQAAVDLEVEFTDGTTLSISCPKVILQIVHSLSFLSSKSIIAQNLAQFGASHEFEAEVAYIHRNSDIRFIGTFSAVG